MNDAVGAYEYIILDCGVTLKIKILTNLVYGFLETDIGNRFKEVVGNIKLISFKGILFIGGIYYYR